MFQDKYVFSQLTAFLNRTQFNNYVRKYDGNRYVKHFTCWNLFGFKPLQIYDLIIKIQNNRGINRAKVYKSGLNYRF